jgi:hypothetical protein
MGGVSHSDYEAEPAANVDWHLRFEHMDVEVDNTLQERARRKQPRR